MSPDQIHVILVLAAAGAVLFLLLLSWALDYKLIEIVELFAWILDRRLADIIRAVHALSTQLKEPWVERAYRALGDLPPPRRFGTLEGWSWRPVDGDPVMTVRVQDRSPDGRRLEGYIVATHGTLQVACKARTQMRLIEGWITLTAEDGPPMTLRAGDTLVIQSGFRGQWENEGFTHLAFSVTLPRSAGQAPA